MSSLKDRLIYFYIREIKKKMECPACRNHIMRVNKMTGEWKCEFCGYHFSIEEFESGMVFWFCDGCESFLNNQDGFSDKKRFFVCRQCGYMNELTEDNIHK
jgi:Primosomal protein N'' (replication factor Y) - superfamily II helicase